MPSNASRGHAFISYMHEDDGRVAEMVAFLEKSGVRVWRDREELWPGDLWKAEIRRAIQNNALAFIACFSEASGTRPSHQNEELLLAVEAYRRLRPDSHWLFPVRFADVELPYYDLGAGRTLYDLHRADLFGQRRTTNLERLTARVAGVVGTDPKIRSKKLYQPVPRQVEPKKGRLTERLSDIARRRWQRLVAGAISLLLLALIITVEAQRQAGSPGVRGSLTAGGPSHTTFSRSPSPIPAREARSTRGPCGYSEDKSRLTGGALFDVGLPPDPTPTPTKSYTAVFKTNLGTIRATLDGESAPCNVQSIRYLISKKFYDQTSCPRSVNSDIFGIQCGDPSGTTADGPTYTTKDENLVASSYTAGTVIMANRGSNTNGSQIFFFTEDSNPALHKYFTVIGHVTDGLTILQNVVSSGNDDSNPVGGGKPNIPLYFTTVTVSP